MDSTPKVRQKMLLTFSGLLEPSAGNFEFLSLGRRELIRDLRTFQPHIDRDNLGHDETWALADGPLVWVTS